jgi:hypothetical protein
MTKENTINDLKDGGSVYSFLCQSFLYWLEALSLMRSLSVGILITADDCHATLNIYTALRLTLLFILQFESSIPDHHRHYLLSVNDLFSTIEEICLFSNSKAASNLIADIAFLNQEMGYIKCKSPSLALSSL